MRLFLAVPLEPSLKERLGRLVADLSRAGADCKWVRTENLHLTLEFLGEVPEERLPALKEAARRALEGAAAFDAALAGLGAFPGMESPRILWVGLSEGGPALEDLARRLREGLAAAGFRGPEAGRDFKAHLTVGRLRSRRNLASLQKAFEAAGAGFAEPWRLRVERVVLVKSRLRPKGPAYSVLHEARLAG